MYMKKIFLFLGLIFTVSVFSQTERNQKIEKRVERDAPSPSIPPPYVVTPRPYVGPYYRPYQPWYNNRYYRNSFYYGAAPLAGSRTRPYRESDLIFGLGIVSSIMIDEPSTLGIRMMMGGKYLYIFGNYQYSNMNPHSHYDNITLVDVISWNDDYRQSITTNINWDLGVGMRINKHIYPTVSVGNNKIREYLVYFDELRVLSEDGLYSINGGEKDIFSLTAGVDFHLNKYVVINTALGVAGPPRLTLGGMVKFE